MRTFPESQASSPVGRPSVGPDHAAGSLPRPVSGLLFDACDVLYDDTAWRRWLLRVLSRLGLHTNYRSFYHVWKHDFLDDVYRGRREFSEAFQAFLLSAGLSRAQVDEVQAACQARRSQWEATARPLPGVKSTLNRLRAAGVAMGVLSDSEHPATMLTERLERIGLGGLFKAVVSSIDLERTKPDPICYRTALRAMSLSAHEVAFVGHDTEELAGAANVGMPTVAVNYDPDAQADALIARFEELIGLAGTRSPHDATARKSA